MNAAFPAEHVKPGSKSDQPALTILIAAPRGFCAGVDRAIEIVERALERYGAPVYVRHEIVHNRYVVDGLRAKGAIFIEELDEVPDDAPVVFSAHGVPKSVPAEAERRKLLYVDATCPLVSKVHRQAERQLEKDRHIIFIGHAGHPEVIGTMGQVPEDRMTLVETVDDVATLDFAEDDELSFLTQTTLSVDDTAEIVAALEADGGEFADAALKAIRRGSPISVAATLAILRAVRDDPTIENALTREYRFTYRSQQEGDFLEGIRAAVIDKDRDPQWSVARIEDLPRERVEAILAPLGDNELTWEERA